ncbi:TRAP transporter small permease [Falsiroseomonas oryzae]|uniref:TRAP transporter small permease n=1 Tax=Falsiroseomonas oryzae TaxID=2766473 RepID=UPI0022EA9374|nr:TRAP transporter small permease subunit [Roseomonas sp. MO-31]
MSLLRGVDRTVAMLCRWGVILAMLGLFVLLLVAVVGRSVPALAVSGYDEIVELLVVWLTMLGAVALWREGALYRVASLEAALPRPARRALALAQQLIMLGFALALVWWGWIFLVDSMEIAPFLGIDKGWWYAAIPIAGVPMAAYSLAGIWRILRGGADAMSGGGSLIA